MGTHWIDLYTNNNCMATFQKKSKNLFYTFYNFYKLILATQLIFEKNSKLILNYFLKENISMNQPDQFISNQIMLGNTSSVESKKKKMFSLQKSMTEKK